MGLGKSKIDYKERDFTKQPLEDEEIDILLDALPEDSIIGSLDSEAREEIVSTINSEKLFNLKSDSIFDYYFTNKKEAIKGCMNDSIKQNEVSKFMKRLNGSPTMKLTVEECREYANNIGAPFQPDYNNDTNPKGCFSQVHSTGINKVYYNNTSNEDTNCGAHGKSYCIEKNDGIITKKEGTPAQNMTEDECEAYAESLGLSHWVAEGGHQDNNPSGCQIWSDGNIKFNRVQNDLPCTSVSKDWQKGCIEKKHTPTPCPDDNFNKMIDTIPGVIEQPMQKILQNKSKEYNTEKNALRDKHNTEKSSLQSQHNDLLGLIGNHKVIDSGRIVDNITEEECKQLYEVQLGKDFASVPNTDRPKGCYRSGKHYRYAKNGHLQCGKGNDDCIITKPTWTKFRQDMLDHGVELRNSSDDTDTLMFRKTSFGYLIPLLPAKASNWRDIKAKGSSWDIGTAVYIFQDAYKHKSFPWFEIYKKMEQYQVGKFTKITFGMPTEGVSEKECKDYAYRTGLKWFGAPSNWTDRPKGCVLHKSTDRVFYNLKDNDKKCSGTFNCIQNSEKYTSKRCGGTIGGWNDCRVGGGWGDVVVPGWDRNKYGKSFDDAKHFCNNSEACVAVAHSGGSWNWPVHTTSLFKPCNKGDICDPRLNYYTKDVLPEYYKVTGSGVCDKPEDIVPQDECKQAASALKYNPKSTSFGNTGEHAQSGCFMDGTTLFHFDNKWKGANYRKVGKYGGRKYLCKKSTKCVGSKDKNEPYHHDNLKNPGCCNGLKPFEYNGVKYCKKM